MHFDGIPHGALTDARNTARLHAAILRRIRRDPDPVLPPICDREEVVSLSPFAENLVNPSSSPITQKEDARRKQQIVRRKLEVNRVAARAAGIRLGAEDSSTRRMCGAGGAAR